MSCTPEPVTFEQRVSRSLSVETYERIRSLWLLHGRALEDRDLEAVLSAFTEDCVFEVVPIDQVYEGHRGARNFYMEMFRAFPDAKIRIEDFVIGPQGVFQVGLMRATQKGPWGGLPPTGRLVEMRLIVFFPWNEASGQFSGERIWFG